MIVQLGLENRQAISNLVHGVNGAVDALVRRFVLAISLADLVFDPHEQARVPGAIGLERGDLGANLVLPVVERFTVPSDETDDY